MEVCVVSSWIRYCSNLHIFHRHFFTSKCQLHKSFDRLGVLAKSSTIVVTVLLPYFCTFMINAQPHHDPDLITTNDYSNQKWCIYFPIFTWKHNKVDHWSSCHSQRRHPETVHIAVLCKTLISLSNQKVKDGILMGPTWNGPHRPLKAPFRHLDPTLSFISHLKSRLWWSYMSLYEPPPSDSNCWHWCICPMCRTQRW